MNVKFPLNAVHHFGSQFFSFWIAVNKRRHIKECRKKHFSLRAKKKNNKIHRQKILLCTQYYTFQSSLSVHFLCVLVECWCFSCSHYIAKNHRFFSLGFFFLLNIVFLVKMNFLWYFSAFVSLILSNKSNNRSWWIFTNFCIFWLFQRAKLQSSFTLFCFFGWLWIENVRIFQYMRFFLCMSRIEFSSHILWHVILILQTIFMAVVLMNGFHEFPIKNVSY